MIRRSIEDQLTAMGTISVSIDMEAYKMMKGVKLATTIKTNIMGIEMVGSILSLTVDKKIPDSEFQLPETK